MPRRALALVLAAGLWLWAAPALAETTQQQTPPPSTTGQATSTDQSTKLPGQTAQTDEDVSRVKKALEKPPALDLDQQQLKFYMEVYAKQPKFEDLVGAFDLKHGQVPHSSMTHQDFLNQVTPKELYATSGGITPAEALQFAVTNWAAQAIIRKGLEDMRNAKTEAEVAAIRSRIDKELAALKGPGK